MKAEAADITKGMFGDVFAAIGFLFFLEIEADDFSCFKVLALMAKLQMKAV
jgi:hypothetical protein